MKYTIQYIVIIVVLFVGACTHDDFQDESALAQLEVADAFVRFDNADPETYEAEEGGEALELTLEFPFPTPSDVAVSYSFGGTAVWGQDFNIEGATEAGGMATLSYDPEDEQITTEDIIVTFPNDGMLDGDKELIITLETASLDNGGNVTVGQADQFRSVTVDIKDNDCGVGDLTGTYAYDMVGDLGNLEGTVMITAGDGDNAYVISDFAGNGFGEPTPYEFMVNDDASITAPAQSTVSEGVAATITGQLSTCDQVITMDIELNCCGGEGFRWRLNLTPVN